MGFYLWRVAMIPSSSSDNTHDNDVALSRTSDLMTKTCRNSTSTRVHNVLLQKSLLSLHRKVTAK